MDTTQRALERALRSLASRDHSEHEIAEKLARAGFEEHAIAGAMARLSACRLIDDTAFAQKWTASRARHGMGPQRIAHELRQKGIDRETADAALAEMDAEETLAAAVAFASSRLLRGGNNIKQRTYAALVRRGYAYGTARKALELAAAAQAPGTEDDER